MAADLHTEGLQYLLEVALTEEQSAPASFYMGLCEDDALNEDDGLADLTELSGDGYARVAVASDDADLTSASVGTLDRKVTTKTCTFTADGGNWNGATKAFLATTADDAGKLIASADLGAERFLLDGDSLEVTMVIQLNG